MLNQVILVGRIAKEFEIEVEEGRNKVKVVIAVPRSIKNENGEDDTDFIECYLWDAIAQNTKEYCHKGDIIGVKGRIVSEIVDEVYKQEIIAEKVTFLSSNRKDDNNE